jgi:hypothetical protein
MKPSKKPYIKPSTRYEAIHEAVEYVKPCHEAIHEAVEEPSMIHP